MTELRGSKGLYSLGDRIGSGGNGTVYSATGPEGPVAVKILHRRARPDAQARFRREVGVLRALGDDPGVLPLVDSDPNLDCGRLWFAMPRATGIVESLGIDASLGNICAAMASVGATLARLHARHIAHRDIKPANLFWFAGSWRIGDFGLATFKGAEAITLPGDKLGPVYYIAPEMIIDAQSADGRAADVYSLGKTVWVLATGQAFPLPGPHDPTFAAVAIASFRRDERSIALDELVRRMTLLDPGMRPDARMVSRELTLLTTEHAAGEPGDPNAALERLRLALASHQARRNDRARRIARAARTAATLEAAVEKITQLIGRRIYIVAKPWTPPAQWGFMREWNGPNCTWERALGYSFAPEGEEQTFRLGVGFRCVLLSDDTLTAHVGYCIDSMREGVECNGFGWDPGWNRRISEGNGLPSCERAVAALIAEFHSSLPASVDRYAGTLRGEDR